MFQKNVWAFILVWQGQQSPSADAPQTSGDVPPIRIGPSGRIETEEEYQARMAHNSYMRFSRSLRRTLSALVNCLVPVAFYASFSAKGI